MFQGTAHPPEDDTLEYIQTDGSCYFDTGIYPTQDFSVEARFKIPTPLSGEFLYGARDSTSVAQFGMYINASNNIEPRWGMSNLTSTHLSSTSGSIFEIEQNKDIVRLKHSRTWIPDTQTFSTGSTMYIFGMNTAGTADTLAVSGTQLFYFKIRDGEGNLVRDFKPKVDANGVLGLWDRVTKTMFYNKGTGTLAL